MLGFASDLKNVTSSISEHTSATAERPIHRMERGQCHLLNCEFCFLMHKASRCFQHCLVNVFSHFFFIDNFLKVWNGNWEKQEPSAYLTLKSRAQAVHKKKKKKRFNSPSCISRVKGWFEFYPLQRAHNWRNFRCLACLINNYKGIYAHGTCQQKNYSCELLSSFLFVAFNQIRNANTMQEIKKERCCDACFVKVL